MPPVVQVTFATYVPANNSVFLGNSVADTGSCCGIELSRFTRTALHVDDLTFFYNGTFDVTEGALDLGVQGGTLAIPGDIKGPTGSPSHTQDGGIANFIDPVALVFFSSLNLNSRITAAGYTIPTQSVGTRGTACTPPLSALAWSPANSKVVVAYEYCPLCGEKA